MNILNSADTAATVNLIMRNAKGTTTTTDGATAAGLIAKENMETIISGGFDMPHPTSVFEGVPPFSFISNGEPLVNWIIYGKTGGVGDKTANLYNTNETEWNGGIKNANGEITSSTVSHFTLNYTEVSPETSYYIAGNLGASGNAHRIYYYDENKEWISRSDSFAYNARTFTTPANCKYIQIQVVNAVTSTADWMLVEGETAPTTFEPYGYKIPVTCGGATTNIYIDEPLTAGETVSYADTSTVIPTSMFLNTLSVGTTVQPEKVFIEYVK